MITFLSIAKKLHYKISFIKDLVCRVAPAAFSLVTGSLNTLIIPMSDHSSVSTRQSKRIERSCLWGLARWVKGDRKQSSSLSLFISSPSLVAFLLRTGWNRKSKEKPKQNIRKTRLTALTDSFHCRCNIYMHFLYFHMHMWVNRVTDTCT